MIEADKAAHRLLWAGEPSTRNISKFGYWSRFAAYFYPRFSTNLLFLGFPWAITASMFMLMLAIMLRRRSTTTL